MDDTEMPVNFLHNQELPLQERLRRGRKDIFLSSIAATKLNIFCQFISLLVSL